MRFFTRIPTLMTVTILTMTLSAGCRFAMLDLGPRKMTTRYFELRSSPASPVSGGDWLRKHALAVDLLQTDTRYDTRFYLVRAGNEVALSESRRWIRPPGEMISRQIRGVLAESGLFACVVGPGSSVRPNLRLSGEVVRFDLAENAGVITSAVLELSAVLLLDTRPDPAANAGSVPRIIWQKKMSAVAPVLNGADPAACAAAMSTAAAQTIQELLRELAMLPQP